MKLQCSLEGCLVAKFGKNKAKLEFNLEQVKHVLAAK